MAPFKRPTSLPPRATCTDPGKGGGLEPHDRRARSYALLALVAVVGLAPGCRMGHPAAAAAHAWASGPVRWLLLPEERRQVLRARSAAELEVLVQEFWQRRECSAGEGFAGLFSHRVAVADRLYGEEGARGCLTDRGRALILLGPPSTLRYSQRTVPAATPGGGPVRPTRILPQEEWVYTASELPTLWASLGLPAGGEVTLVFLVERRGTVLAQGNRILQEAARSLARAPPESARRCRQPVTSQN